MKIHSAHDVQTHGLKKISDLCQIVQLSSLKWLKAAVNHFIVSCLEHEVNDRSLAVNNFTFTFKKSPTERLNRLNEPTEN